MVQLAVRQRASRGEFPQRVLHRAFVIARCFAQRRGYGFEGAESDVSAAESDGKGVACGVDSYCDSLPSGNGSP